MTTETKATELKAKLIVGTDAIKKETASVAAAGKKLDSRIQVLGLSVLSHIELHGDVTLLNGAYHALPRGARKKAYHEWVLKFGKVVANIDAKGKLNEEAPYLYNKAGKTDLLGAEAKPWYDFAPDKIEEPMDFVKLLDALLKKAGKAETGVGFTDAAQADAVKAIIAARASIKTEAHGE